MSDLGARTSLKLKWARGYYELKVSPLFGWKWKVKEVLELWLLRIFAYDFLVSRAQFAGHMGQGTSRPYLIRC